jgi:hypothetical protein
MDWPRGINFLVSMISRSDLPRLFLWRFLKDEVYFAPVPITLNILKD